MKMKFKPSYNVCPGMACPVLISKNHLYEFLDVDPSLYTDRVLATMQWGLIPHWFKGDAKAFHMKTINCRSEGIEEKAAFRNAIKNGRRCVVVAQGFYEWQKGTNQPFYIHPSDSSELIYLAGLFDVWKEEQHYIYTFSVITCDAKESPIACIDGRMPVILENDDAIDEWLNYEVYSFDESKKLLKAAKLIAYHPVSKDVNNTSNDSVNNINEINKLEKTEKKKQSTLDRFLIKKCSKLDIKSPPPSTRQQSRSRSRSPI